MLCVSIVDLYGGQNLPSARGASTRHKQCALHSVDPELLLNRPGLLAMQVGQATRGLWLLLATRLSWTAVWAWRAEALQRACMHARPPMHPTLHASTFTPCSARAFIGHALLGQASLLKPPY